MSMNLFCKEVSHLVQTPTYITRLCLYSDLDLHRKSPWQTVMKKYLMWVSEICGNQNQQWDVVKAQEKMFKKAVRDHKRLHFGEM